MIYVAVGLAGHQPGTGTALLARTAGIAAAAISAVSGLLLVPDGMSFEVSVTVSLTDFLVLAGWLYLVSRWLGRSSHSGPGTARLRCSRRVARSGQQQGGRSRERGAPFGRRDPPTRPH